MHGLIDAAIAVVIPTLDEASAIEGCLRSVGEEASEIVVVDGGSVDGTRPLAAGFAGVRVLEGHRGRGPQLNHGARETLAPILLFLHADCRLPTGWSRAVRDCLADSGTALSCFRLCTEPSDRGAGQLSRLWCRLADLRSFGLGLPYGDQAFALRRSCFELIGGFPDIPLMEDVALARACRRIGRIRSTRMTVRTTARRYEALPVKSRMMMATFPTLFRLGVSPRRLATWYGRPR